MTGTALDKALARVIVAVMKDDTELFKQYSDNPDFKRWLADEAIPAVYLIAGTSEGPRRKDQLMVTYM